jgi:hypothetical protein
VKRCSFASSCGNTAKRSAMADPCQYYMARRLRLCWIWSAHQLFVDEPGWFMAGLLSVVPASILIVLHYGARALRALGVEGI